VVKGDRDPVALRVAMTATLTLAPVAVGLLFLGSAASWLTAAALIVSPALVGRTWWRRHRTEWVLRATYRRHQVDLFSCTDTRTFGQVKRALLRALEGRESRRDRWVVAHPQQVVPL
jgi:cytochrome c biogenesis protein ResB